MPTTVSLFVFFVLSHLVLLFSAEEGNNHGHSCSSPFFCGKLGTITFPFYMEKMNSTCGFFKVNCSEPVQSIQLEKGGRWYIVEDISEANTITITDPVLREYINSRNCNVFNNLTLPNIPWISHSKKYFPLISLVTKDFQTLFQCNPTLNFTSPKNFDYISCKDYKIYYRLSNDTSQSFPSQCSVVQLPSNRTRAPSKSGVFTSLSATFFVDVHIPGEFYKCYFRGLQINSAGKYECVDEMKGNKSLPLKLGLGIGGPVILIIIISSLFVIWCRYRKKYASSDFLPRNISSDPSKSDLEGGSVYYGVPIFSYSELEEVTSNFDSDKLLGDGGFGTVYYGKLPDGREVAVKRLYEHNYRRVEQFMNEIEILTRLHHKNLVTLYGCTSRRSRDLLLVYEFIPNGTVADHLHGDQAKPGSLPWPVRLRIATEIASALAYLHASDIIHRDVKTNNILLDNNFCVKVADFGLSRLFPNDVTHVSTAPQGTPGYVDPEYHQCYQLTDKSDVYSFGVVLIELITSMPAVDTSRHRHEINLANLAINRIQKCAFNELIDPNLGYESDEEVRRMTTSVAELAFRCLQQDKEMRPTMDEVLEELKRIQTGEYNLDNAEETHDDNEVMKIVQSPPSPPDYDEPALLKNIRLPPSPDSVTQKCVSSNTTPNTSG